MSPAVILVRHAMPELVRGVASKLWGLGESSREDCVLLAHALPPGITAIWSSSERKARETADVLALRLGPQVQVDDRFGEVDRPTLWDRDYQEVAAGYVGGFDEPGWESREAVVRRFGEPVDAARSRATGDILIVNHGMAMTLWLANAISLPDPVAWWRNLTFPDAWRVDLEAGTLDHFWPGGAPAE